MAILDKFLNQFGLSWSGSYKDYYSEDTGAVASPRGPIDQSCNEYERPSKIAILVNSRCVKENLSKDANLSMSRLIEEEMTYFSFIPYQICNCAYIGEHKAWAMYNLNNKRTLSLAINEINYHLGTLHDLEEDSAIEKIIPADYQINFNSICFDYGLITSPEDLPRSYLIYAPKTKSGKKSQYPLIAFFNTSKYGIKSIHEENYIGELCYSVNGEMSKACIHCWKHGKFAEFNFSVVGRSFLISTIKTIGESGKLFTLYDCMWKFTDYIDFADQ